MLKTDEIEMYVANRGLLHSELTELQADLEDLSDKELLELRETMLERVNKCMELILENDDDNL